MDELLKYLLGPLGLTFALLFIIYAGYKEWWVWGPTHRKTVAEKEEWKAAALRGATITEWVIQTHEDEKKRDNNV